MKVFILAATMVSSILLVAGDLQWQDVEGVIRWAKNCEFQGPAFEQSQVDVAACVVQCASNLDCIYFTYNEGNCSLKDERANEYPIVVASGLCGYVPDRLI